MTDARKALESAREALQDCIVTFGEPDGVGDWSSIVKARTALAAIDAALASGEQGNGERELIRDLWGVLNFILAFYEPGQRYLDTEAWKQAEAGGRRAHKAARDYLDAAPPAPETRK